MKASQSLYNKINWIQTGFGNLDRILGGGIPQRKITEVSGVFSVGKSTLALHIIGKAQKQRMATLWCDSEYSFTQDYSEALGVNCDELDLIQNRFAEDSLDSIEEWAEKHKNALIVLDSIGGLLPRAEAEKDASGKVIGGQAKLISTFCRKMIPILAINNNSLIVLNHQFVDLMSGKLKTSGGAKLEYAKSIWLMLRAANKRIMQGENQIGLVIEAEIRKNKVARTVRQKTELSMIFGEGFSGEQDLMEDAIEKGIIQKKGNSFFFEGEKVAVGKNKLREALKDESFSAKLKAKAEVA